MLQRKIGDRVVIKNSPGIVWEIIKKTQEYYVVHPLNWKRELRVGMITDEEIQGLVPIWEEPTAASLNKSFTNNKFRILELMGLKYSKEMIEKKQVRQFILSTLTPLEIEINKWGQDDLEELADALYTLTINFWGVYYSLKEKNNRGT